MTTTTALTSTFQVNDIVIYTRTSGKTSRALITEINYVGGRPAYMIHLLDNGLEKNVAGSSLTLVKSANDRDYDKDNLPRVYQPDIWERFYFYVRGTVRSLSWYTIFFGFLAILRMWPDKQQEQQWLME